MGIRNAVKTAGALNDFYNFEDIDSVELAVRQAEGQHFHLIGMGQGGTCHHLLQGIVVIHLSPPISVMAWELALSIEFFAKGRPLLSAGTVLKM